jgi:hypothetical protein
MQFFAKGSSTSNGKGAVSNVDNQKIGLIGTGSQGQIVRKR